MHRGIVWKVVSILIILVALLFLLCGIIVLWHRLFSDDFPNSCLSNLYQSLRDMWPVKEIISLRDTSPGIWGGIFRAIQGPDEKNPLEPIRSFITCIGVGSFTLTAYNEYSAKRFQGILLKDVLQYYFPFHRIILYFFHTVFFFVGNYACIKKVSSAGFACLAGLIVCFIYSTAITQLLVIPRSGQKRFIHGYLRAMVKHGSRGNQQDAEEQGQNAYICIIDYASYIGELWNRSGYQPAFNMHKSEEFWLIRVVYAWINRSPLDWSGEFCWIRSKWKWLNQKISSKAGSDFADVTSETPMKMQAALASFFNQPSVNCGEWILFAECLPHNDSRAQETFQTKALKCRAVWEELFAQVTNSRRRSQMAYHILSCAYSYNPECFTLVASGLLLQSGIFQNSETDSNKQVTKAIEFLQSLNLKEARTPSIMNDQLCCGFPVGWGELMCMGMCGILWGYATGIHSPTVIENARKQFRRAVFASLGAETYLKLTQHRQIYIVFAFMLFCADNIDIYKEMSARQISLRYNLVCQELDRLVDA